MNRRSVTVRVPASTSNLGSGFDTLGLAVRLYNHIRVTWLSGKDTRLVSPRTEIDPKAATAMVQEAAHLFFRRARKAAIGFHLELRGNVPIARGLGFSSTVRVGVLAALNHLTGARWDRRQLLELATQLEGHPDNASPAIFGGFTVSGILNKRVRCLRFNVSSKLKLVTLIPRLQISTSKARTLVPQLFSKADTLHALNRAALITAALAGRDYAALHGVFDDRVHQPYREQLLPQLTSIIRAGERAGAIGGFLSGSGSAIICLASEKPEAVAAAMQNQMPDSEMKILGADNRGFEME